jgi:hypothetical protein
MIDHRHYDASKAQDNPTNAFPEVLSKLPSVVLLRWPKRLPPPSNKGKWCKGWRTECPAERGAAATGKKEIALVNRDACRRGTACVCYARPA